MMTLFRTHEMCKRERERERLIRLPILHGAFFSHFQIPRLQMVRVSEWDILRGRKHSRHVNVLVGILGRKRRESLDRCV